MLDGKKMMNLNILDEDNHLIVVLKPYNVPVQADDSKDVDLLTIVKNYLKTKYHKPGNVYLGLVHRLDRPVGGIMVLAKTSKAAARLNTLIKNHDFKKTYLAVVHGQVKNSERLVSKITRDPRSHNSYIDPVKGKESILEYQCLGYNQEEDLSLIKINLITGRHHQIRVQMVERGNPLYGDNRYGLKELVPIHLFAYHLEFMHPVQKELKAYTVIPELKDKWLLFKTELNNLANNE